MRSIFIIQKYSRFTINICAVEIRVGMLDITAETAAEILSTLLKKFLSPLVSALTQNGKNVYVLIYLFYYRD